MPPEYVAIDIAVGRTVMTGQWDIDPDRNSSHTLVAVKRNLKLHFYRFSYILTQFIGRPEESRALTEELRRELWSVFKRKID
jgi:hypothetical protein